MKDTILRQGQQDPVPPSAFYVGVRDSITNEPLARGRPGDDEPPRVARTYFIAITCSTN